ncbi:MAG: type 4a pilus biogenesis protein PilO [Desulfuromonadales bacterium]|nr:type 4a pilus biogenesis protein PilO [Desulfuromonadales bacterium]
MSEGLLAAAWRVNRPLPLAALLLLLCNLGLFAWIFFGLSPQANDLERRLLDRQALARKSVEEREQILTPRKRYRQIEADLQAFRQAIPARNELTGLLKEIFTLAGNAGLNIERISYDPKQVEENQLLRYGLVFSVGGEYGQIKKFIYLLEQSTRIIAIEEIALSSNDSDAGAGVKLNIRLATYFRLDQP